MTVRISEQIIGSDDGKFVVFAGDAGAARGSVGDERSIGVRWSCGDSFVFKPSTILAAINDLEIVCDAVDDAWVRIETTSGSTVMVTLRGGDLYADTMMREDVSEMDHVPWTEMRFALRRALRASERGL